MNQIKPTPRPRSDYFPSIAVLIVNYRTKDYVQKLLESFRNHEDYPGSVAFYIGDNASGDDISGMQKVLPDFPVRTFQFQENGGFGAWNNALAEWATEPVLFMVNPDVTWTEPVMARLVKALDDPERVVVGPKLRLPDGSSQWWDHGELYWILAGMVQRMGSSFWKDRDEAADVAWVSGAAFMVKADAFRAVDGFDENFFLYREEEDLCLRLRERGGGIYYDPSVSMTHVWSVIARKSKHMARSQDRFFAKHHPLLSKTRIYPWLTRMFWKLQDTKEKVGGR